jgi:Concanavalin A-like lectin/glucanases superfamily/Calcineurin-like phosphoesterase
MFIRVLALLLIWLNINIGQCEEPFIFVSVADIHNVETFIHSASPKIPDFDLLLNKVAGFKPGFVFLAGDLGEQHWWNSQSQKLCAPNGSLSDVVSECAAKAYPRFLSYVKNRVLSPVYVGLGDHEIGDNDWTLGVRSDSVPYFKQAFARYFTKNSNGTSRFNAMIGNVPPRPIGTPYENTSYAFIAANTLFVMLDLFRQDSPVQKLGYRGTVKLEVGNDGHLQWLEKLLATARNLPELKHIIVNGHSPVLSPVKGQNSSMMYVEDGQDSGFWKLLRKYKVDIYLTGEVHCPTAIKDNNSNLIQISQTRGNQGFIVGRIEPESIELDQYILDTNSIGAKSFIKEGALIINKAQSKYSLQTTGMLLKPIDPNGLILHYSFDNDNALEVKNYGSFGSIYNATSNKVTFSDYAAWFSDALGSVLKSKGISPLGGHRARTISVWLRTTDNKIAGAYIYPSGQFWNPNGPNGFRLLAANGILKLQINSWTMLQADQGSLRLNDYRWHHVAVSYQRISTTDKDEILFYIDGKKYGTVKPVTQRIETELVSDPVNIGGRRNDQSIAGWTGWLDDFALWAKPLSPLMIRSISSCSKLLGYNAGDMEKLFKLYQVKSNNLVPIKGLNWRYSKLTPSDEGICTRQIDNTITLRLEGTGQGVITVAR